MRCPESTRYIIVALNRPSYRNSYSTQTYFRLLICPSVNGQGHFNDLARSPKILYAPVTRK